MSKFLATLGMSTTAVLLAACGGSDNNSTPTPVAATPTPATSAAAYLPAKGESAAYIDTRLQLTFDAPPQPGRTGTIKVYKADGTLVDTVDVSNAIVNAGGETQTVI